MAHALFAAVSRAGRLVVQASAFAGAVAIVWHFVPQPAREALAAMAVYDSANHTANTQTASNTAKIAALLEQILVEARKTNAVLGLPGPCSSGAGTPSAAQLASVSAIMDGQRPQMQQWQLPSNLPLNLGNVAGARQFITQALFKQVQGSAPGIKDNDFNSVERYRETARREATQAGFAVAYQQKQEIPASANRAASAAGQADSALTIKDAACAQNKLLASAVEQLVALRAISAASTDVQSALMVNDLPIDLPRVGREMAPVTFGQGSGGKLGE